MKITGMGRKLKRHKENCVVIHFLLVVTKPLSRSRYGTAQGLSSVSLNFNC